MVVTGNQLHTAQSALFQAFQEGSPMGFMLAQRHRNAQDLPFTLRIDAHRTQNRQIANVTIFPDLLVVGIQEEKRVFA